MNKSMVLTGPRYDRLVVDLRKLIDQGRSRAQAAANWELLKTYWNVGYVESFVMDSLENEKRTAQSEVEALADKYMADSADKAPDSRDCS